MVHARKPGVYRDMEARRAYRRAWMAATRARASTKSGEAAARQKEPVAAHPQKSNRAIAAETGVDFRKSYPESRPKIRIPITGSRGGISGTSGAISNRAASAPSASGFD